jgi:hypothetical protein
MHLRVASLSSAAVTASDELMSTPARHGMNSVSKVENDGEAGHGVVGVSTKA